jgi:hypothetical protein
MNALLLVVCFILVAVYTCRKETSVDSGTPEITTADTVKRISFESEVEPILRARCVPCHFPGGKMFERMPFDQPATVLDHKDGILKRIKDETEAKKILDFIDQQVDSL